MPARDLIVIDYSRMNRVPFDLEDTLRHELSHILLHQEIDVSSLPKWLDEGVAQWASGGMADILRTGEKDLLQRAVLSHRLIALDNLRQHFRLLQTSSSWHMRKARVSLNISLKNTERRSSV